MFKRIIALLICITFFASNFQTLHAQDFSINQLPVPGSMVGLSKAISPISLKGIVVNPQKPLELQFIVDTGSENTKAGSLSQEQIKEESDRLVKYFLAGLTIPEGDLWVNLSPYEKDRIVPEALGQTDLGRDLLAQDYILKQLTASLIYPEKDLGKAFWTRVYAKAQSQFGTTNIPVNTFNKVWILPNQAQVFENGPAAYVTQSTLKVMLDEDYTARSKNTTKQTSSTIGSQIIRDIVLPEIEKEVNTGKNFAPLRQIYQAMILAKWYKETIQNGLLDAVYTNKSKTECVNLNDPSVKEQIYQRYLQAYKKGVFSYIKEDSTSSAQAMPRKYFSGGITTLQPPKVSRDGKEADISSDGAMIILTVAIVAAGAALIAGGFAIQKALKINRIKKYEEIRDVESLFKILVSSEYDDEMRAVAIDALISLNAEDLINITFDVQKYLIKQKYKALVNFSRFENETIRTASLEILKRYDEVIKRLKERQPAEARGSLLDHVDLAYQFFKDGYDFRVKYDPIKSHEKETYFGDYYSGGGGPGTIVIVDKPEILEIYRGDILPTVDLAMRTQIPLVVLAANLPDPGMITEIVQWIKENPFLTLIYVVFGVVGLGESIVISVGLWNYSNQRKHTRKMEAISLFNNISDVDNVISYTFDMDIEVSKAAIKKLQELGNLPQSVVPRLVEALRFSEENKRYENYTAISNMLYGFSHPESGYIYRAEVKKSGYYTERVDNPEGSNYNAPASSGGEWIYPEYEWRKYRRADLVKLSNELVVSRIQQALKVGNLTGSFEDDFNILYAEFINHLGVRVKESAHFYPNEYYRNFKTVVIANTGEEMSGEDFAKSSYKVFRALRFEFSEHSHNEEEEYVGLIFIKDQALISEVGGIDLNKIEVEHTGKTIPVQFDKAQLNELMQNGFDGFKPVITNFEYIQSPFPLLGVKSRETYPEVARL